MTANKPDGIEVDTITFDVNGEPEGLDDESLDGVAGGVAMPNYSECNLNPNGGCY
jgi:hypothetical protein